MNPWDFTIIRAWAQDIAAGTALFLFLATVAVWADLIARLG